MKRSVICLLGVALLVFSGCKPKSPKNDPDDSVYVRDVRFKSLQNKRKAKSITLENQTLQYDETKFNYLIENEYPAVAFQNAIGTLVAPSEFGTLELVLAESASHNEDFTEYSFKLRDDENMVWVKSDGTPYLVDGEPLRIKPSDYLYGIRRALLNGPYQLLDYIKGTVEYYLYLYNSQYNQEFSQMSDIRKAEFINNTIRDKYARSYEIEGYKDNPLTEEDMKDLKTGKRIGVIADDENNTLTFELLETCPYFAPMLSGYPYYPVSEEFYKNNKTSYGKKGCNSVLYSGPYYISDLVPEKQITIKKNPYYNQIAGMEPDCYAYVDEINFVNRHDDDMWDAIENPKLYNQKIPWEERIILYLYDLMKKGEIDSVYTWSDVLYDEFVKGPDGNGTLDNPYSEEVSVIFNDKIDWAWGSFINMGAHNSYASLRDRDSNTIAALKLNDVRKMLLKAFDYDALFERDHGFNNGSGNVKDTAVNTFVPSSYIYDGEGNEYVSTYLAKVYSDNTDMTLEEARAYLANGQYESHQYSDEDMSVLVDNVLEAIRLYNNDESLVSQYGEIKLPLTFEFYTKGYAFQEFLPAETRELNAMNARVNKLDNYSGDINECPYFRIVPTDLVDPSNYDHAAWNGYDVSGPLWGWQEGAAFRDPYNYLRSFTTFEATDGTWAAIFPYLGEEEIDDLAVENNTLVKKDLLGNYRQLVGEAKLMTDLSERYLKFAEAEYDLLENVNIYQPRTSDAVGYRLAFTRLTCIGGPKDAFAALLSGRLTGLWATEEPLSNDETQTMIEEEEEYSEDYFENHPDGIFGE